MSREILVIGATGKQGCAVIDNLLQGDGDFTILAVSRNTASPSAQKLAQKSPKIKLVQGDLDNPALLFENTKTLKSNPVWGVYFVQNPITNQQTPEKEVQQAKVFIDECIKNKVSYFVYGSVDRGGDKSFDNRTPVPHFASKYDIEHYLTEKCSSASMDWTFLRPVGFMDNYKPGFQAKIFLTCWKVATGDRPSQLVAVSDIGYFAAQAFMDPQRYKGQAISLAGDELTFDQAARIFKQKTGREIPTTFGFVASIVLFFVSGVGAMFKWMKEEGFGADVTALKKVHPGIMDFGTYLETQSGFVSKRGN
ncbi:unnamed protein product [Clonostachys rhizophaga]|uniref:NmrA-like domain-containing protein n=1 Tax=Clonostachys rhizophaga TaxID=160324 RepID=A0A9N9VVI5_9HYPO|nr:unnamed protein product [Clonostachys rhizophaga]